MNTQRLLFVQPRRMASLAPIYVALLSLVFLGLLAFAVAFWPENAAPSASRPGLNGVVPATVSPAPGVTRARIVRPATSRGRWA
jgi:hypothetical protein